MLCNAGDEDQRMDPPNRLSSLRFLRWRRMRKSHSTSAKQHAANTRVAATLIPAIAPPDNLLEPFTVGTGDVPLRDVAVLAAAEIPGSNNE